MNRIEMIPFVSNFNLCDTNVKRKTLGRESLGRCRRRWKDNIKMYPRKMGCGPYSPVSR